MATVVSLGIHILDVLGRPVTHIPPGQNLALLDEIRITVAGTAAGASVDLAKLSARVLAMGAVGQDEIGTIVIDTMQRYGIDTSNLVRKPGVQTSATMLPIRPNGERPALHVVGANAELCFEDLNLEAIAGAQFLHYGGASLLPKLDGQPARRVLQYAKARGVITTLDMLGIEQPDMLGLIEPCLPYVDYFMPNIEEARMVCKLQDRLDIIRFFLDRGAGTVILKLGAEGSSIGSREGETRIPAYKINLVDTTGCGDGYCAGFIVGLSMNWSVEEAARLGAAAGSLVATGLGSDAGIVNLEQTVAFMRTAETLPMTS